jgi:hypothetical protein
MTREVRLPPVTTPGGPLKFDCKFSRFGRLISKTVSIMNFENLTSRISISRSKIGNWHLPSSVVLHHGTLRVTYCILGVHKQQQAPTMTEMLRKRDLPDLLTRILFASYDTWHIINPNRWSTAEELNRHVPALNVFKARLLGIFLFFFWPRSLLFVSNLNFIGVVDTCQWPNTKL